MILCRPLGKMRLRNHLNMISGRQGSLVENLSLLGSVHVSHRFMGSLSTSSHLQFPLTNSSLPLFCACCSDVVRRMSQPVSVHWSTVISLLAHPPYLKFSPTYVQGHVNTPIKHSASSARRGIPTQSFFRREDVPLCSTADVQEGLHTSLKKYFRLTLLCFTGLHNSRNTNETEKLPHILTWSYTEWHISPATKA